MNLDADQAAPPNVPHPPTLSSTVMFSGAAVPTVPFGLPANLLDQLEEEHGQEAGQLRRIKSELPAGVSRNRDPINNSEVSYGLLPIRAESKQWSQRRRAEEQRASHSTYRPAVGETLRPVCCLRCARHHTEWQCCFGATTPRWPR